MDQVLVYSRGGNTRKIADAIAEELGVKAGDVRSSRLDPAAKVVFLGSGCYGSLPGEDWKKFVEANDFAGKKVALFSTSGFNAGKEIDVMAGAVKKKGGDVIGSYHCPGQFLLIFGFGHPNRKDLAGAKKFAREMAQLG